MTLGVMGAVFDVDLILDECASEFAFELSF
jgi:hypothetical protein